MKVYTCLKGIRVLLIVFWVYGCAPLPQSTPPPKALVATFEYTPPEKAQVKEFDIAFVLIRPDYAPSFTHRTSKLFSDFR